MDDNNHNLIDDLRFAASHASPTGVTMTPPPRGTLRWIANRCADAADVLEDIELQVKELLIEHRPQWVAEGSYGYTEKPRDGFDPVGCVMCYPHDGHWPCVSWQCADEMDRLLEQRTIDQ